MSKTKPTIRLRSKDERQYINRFDQFNQEKHELRKRMIELDMTCAAKGGECMFSDDPNVKGCMKCCKWSLYWWTIPVCVNVVKDNQS